MQQEGAADCVCIPTLALALVTRLTCTRLWNAPGPADGHRRSALRSGRRGHPRNGQGRLRGQHQAHEHRCAAAADHRGADHGNDFLRSGRHGGKRDEKWNRVDEDKEEEQDEGGVLDVGWEMGLNEHGIARVKETKVTR